MINHIFTRIFVFTISICYLVNLSWSQKIAYRSSDNTHYWKNHPPYAGYWQQDVQYTIRAVIDDSLDVIHATEYRVVYFNNSPHVLTEMYFHLYENAFQPGSYYDNLWRNNHRTPMFGPYEAKGLGTTSENWCINGKPVIPILDNTILRLNLPNALLPNDSVVITCSFKTYFDQGSMRRRNRMFRSYGYKVFNGVHWYPVVCVYDQKFGWHTDQHLDKEFYANFGSFDITLTFPNDYIVEATGDLLNPEEVMPDTLREKIDLKNFAKKMYQSKPDVCIVRDPGKPKTWHFYAYNVHNFAFTASPLYRISEKKVGNIRVIALVQEPHCSKWLPSVDFTAQVIQVYQKDFGPYLWPKIIIADANDGMEYSMLTLDGGTYPGHQSLLAHEVGHMWFYGMVASNETYRASLDEGFTQFMTVWALDKIVGEKRVRPKTSPNPLIRQDTIVTRFQSLYYPYLTDVWSGYDEPLNTHSSGFNGALRHGGGYRLVYYKTGVMLYQLRYVLGDSLFWGAMKHYFNKWKFAHPYPEDFRNAVTEFTQTDLNWFFDQWLETTKYIDYAVAKVKLLSARPAQYTYSITFKRLGRMQMPIKFTAQTTDNRKFNYYIPNTWFVNTNAGTVLPKWYGWDLLHPEYEAVINLPDKLKKVTIDPDLLLADIDRRNNSSTKESKYTFDWRIPEPPLWEKLRIYGRPDLWWNNFEGLQLGYAGRSNYFQQNYFNENYLLVATGFGQRNTPQNLRNQHRWFSFYNYDKFNLSRTWRQLWLYDEFIYASGLLKSGIGLEKLFKKQDLQNPRETKIYVQAYFMYRSRASDTQYLLSPSDWSYGAINSYINMGASRKYTLSSFGNAVWTTEMRTPGAGSDFNYYYLKTSHFTYINLQKLELRTRIFARIGGGITPRESQLYLAGASPEQLFNLRVTRAAGIIPNEWGGFGPTTNHFQQGGDLNIRGYAGYYCPLPQGENVFLLYSGLSGASCNIELDFDQLIPVKLNGYWRDLLHVDTYIFHDMGSITYGRDEESIRNQSWSPIRISSGVGAAIAINFGGLLINPLIIRFDMPLFINYAPASEENLQFRYVVGVGRSF